jgi:hypothetical protein
MPRVARPDSPETNGYFAANVNRRKNSFDLTGPALPFQKRLECLVKRKESDEGSSTPPGGHLTIWRSTVGIKNIVSAVRVSACSSIQ